MFYQVRANLYFSDPDEARDFYHDCELALAKCGVINSGQANVEFSTIVQLDNNHDRDPAQPCELVAAADNQ